MITTILWDVDGTLLDFEYSMRQSLKNCFEWAGLTMTEEIIATYERINDSYWKRLELGQITKAQLLNGRFVSLFEECGIEGVDVKEFRERFQDGLANIYAYVDGAQEICKGLQGKVKQYVITNGVSHTQRNKLMLSGLDQLMDGLFISEEIGFPKPELRFFEEVMHCIEEQDKEKILVVGDSITSDIKGGVMSGLKTCWFNPEGKENETPWQADYQISELKELYQYL